MESPDRIGEALRRFFDECLIDVTVLGDGSYLHLYQDTYARWPLFCYSQDSEITFASVLPVTVPAETRDSISRYLHRANWNLVVGKFEFNEADGEIRFTTSLDIADGDVTTCMLFVLWDAHRFVGHHLGSLRRLLHEAGLAQLSPDFETDTVRCPKGRN